MERNELTAILQVWRACLITEEEFRLSLAYAVQGRKGALAAGMRRVAELHDAGIIG